MGIRADQRPDPPKQGAKGRQKASRNSTPSVPSGAQSETRVRRTLIHSQRSRTAELGAAVAIAVMACVLGSRLHFNPVAARVSRLGLDEGLRQRRVIPDQVSL